jgi:hypothetical protein
MENGNNGEKTRGIVYYRILGFACRDRKKSQTKQTKSKTCAEVIITSQHITIT